MSTPSTPERAERTGLRRSDYSSTSIHRLASSPRPSGDGLLGVISDAGPCNSAPSSPSPTRPSATRHLSRCEKMLRATLDRDRSVSCSGSLPSSQTQQPPSIPSIPSNGLPLVTATTSNHHPQYPSHYAYPHSADEDEGRYNVKNRSRAEFPPFDAMTSVHFHVQLPSLHGSHPHPSSSSSSTANPNFSSTAVISPTTGMVTPEMGGKRRLGSSPPDSGIFGRSDHRRSMSSVPSAAAAAARPIDTGARHHYQHQPPQHHLPLSSSSPSTSPSQSSPLAAAASSSTFYRSSLVSPQSLGPAVSAPGAGSTSSSSSAFATSSSHSTAVPRGGSGGGGGGSSSQVYTHSRSHSNSLSQLPPQMELRAPLSRPQSPSPLGKGMRSRNVSPSPVRTTGAAARGVGMVGVTAAAVGVPPVSLMTPEVERRRSGSLNVVRSQSGSGSGSGSSSLTRSRSHSHSRSHSGASSSLSYRSSTGGLEEDDEEDEDESEGDRVGIVPPPHFNFAPGSKFSNVNGGGGGHYHHHHHSMGGRVSPVMGTRSPASPALLLGVAGGNTTNGTSLSRRASLQSQSPRGVVASMITTGNNNNSNGTKLPTPPPSPSYCASPASSLHPHPHSHPPLQQLQVQQHPSPTSTTLSTPSSLGFDVKIASDVLRSREGYVSFADVTGLSLEEDDFECDCGGCVEGGNTVGGRKCSKNGEGRRKWWSGIGGVGGLIWK